MMQLSDSHQDVSNLGNLTALACAGVSATDLVQAALELQSLLVNRASFGLGPLLHAQPYFSASRHSCEDGLQLDVCGSQIAVPTSLLQVRVDD